MSGSISSGGSSGNTSSRLRRSARSGPSTSLSRLWAVGDSVEIPRDDTYVPAVLVRLEGVNTDTTTDPLSINRRWWVRLVPANEGPEDDTDYELVDEASIRTTIDADVPPPLDTASTEPTSGALGSSRESRRQRREAQVVVPAPPPKSEHGSHTAAATASRKRKAAATKAKNEAKSEAKKAHVGTTATVRKDEECVKIKLLTGTLYLYRGRNRRAEFIRRV